MPMAEEFSYLSTPPQASRPMRRNGREISRFLAIPLPWTAVLTSIRSRGPNPPNGQIIPSSSLVPQPKKALSSYSSVDLTDSIPREICNQVFINAIEPCISRNLQGLVDYFIS